MSRTTNRLTSATLAILMQAAFIALLIFSHTPPAVPEKLTRELTLLLPHLGQAQPITPTPASRPSAVLQAPLPVVPFPPNPAAPSAAPLDTRRLGQSIFGCAPENWSSLTPEQRALCPRPGEGVAVQNAPNLMGSPDHVKDEAYWDAELARKKSPLRLPCTGGLGIDPICLVAMFSSGKLTDPREWPVYETKKLAPNTLYKAEQIYDAWHKDHPVKRDAAAAPPEENPP